MKKKILSILLIGILVVGLTGCGNNTSQNNIDNSNDLKEDTKVEENGSSIGSTVIDNEYLTIRYINKEHKKMGGMLNNKATSFNLPMVLFHFTSKSNEKLRIEVRSAKNLDDIKDYFFVLTEKGGKPSNAGGIDLDAKDDFDAGVIYQRTKNLEQEYPLSELDGKIIYVSLYKYDEVYKTLIEEYEINISELN